MYVIYRYMKKYITFAPQKSIISLQYLPLLHHNGQGE